MRNPNADIELDFESLLENEGRKLDNDVLFIENTMNADDACESCCNYKPVYDYDGDYAFNVCSKHQFFCDPQDSCDYYLTNNYQSE